MNNQFFTKTIIKWYGDHQRDLPWRSTIDPYKIWLSEIILQQTRVDQGLPYYLKFIENYPNIRGLAQAKEEQVLKLWEGLGYYSRAKNLHKCAKKVVEQYNGLFPDNYNDLLTLPGIGPYSAAAIASFAFKEPVAVLDGNVYRVISRVFGIKEDIAQAKSAKVFTIIANELLDRNQPDIHNQAIMEYGAIHCKPKRPCCGSCGLSSICYAYAHGQQQQLPVKSKKTKATTKYFNYFVFEKQGKLAMKRRDDASIWKGLYDFYLIRSDQKLDTEELLIKLSLRSGKVAIDHISKEYKHLLTHLRIYATFYKVRDISEPQSIVGEMAYYSFGEIEDLPKPVLISKYLKENIF